ncbi:MAG: hypothetical protein Ct9H300mP28_38170 [Pseudomonadota bacterium]|nr:MAG: hypothetical protein Ct9H300mP28_38170 [Pseudomonadota bacterium]
MNDLSQKMTLRFREFMKNYGRDLEMKVEPGKLLVGTRRHFIDYRYKYF